MTLVSNDPSYWPLIDSNRFSSYFVVASFAAVVYDWALTLGQEFDLVWRKRWTPMTVLYIAVRYAIIPYSVAIMLLSNPSVSLTDAVSSTTSFALNWITMVINALLDAIMITRLYAMYHQSRMMLIFLTVIVAFVTVACAVLTGVTNNYISGEELILSGIHGCGLSFEGLASDLLSMPWLLWTAWEVLALCLALWIAMKHFRELPRSSARRTLGDCYTVLMKTHLIYFTSAVAVSSFNSGYLSPTLASSSTVGAEVYYGLLEIMSFIQMFVLGPRLILGLREFNAKTVAGSDVRTSMTTVAFQEWMQESTDSSV